MPSTGKWINKLLVIQVMKQRNKINFLLYSTTWIIVNIFYLMKGDKHRRIHRAWSQVYEVPKQKTAILEKLAFDGKSRLECVAQINPLVLQIVYILQWWHFGCIDCNRLKSCKICWTQFISQWKIMSPKSSPSFFKLDWPSRQSYCLCMSKNVIKKEAFWWVITEMYCFMATMCTNKYWLTSFPKTSKLSYSALYQNILIISFSI